MDKDRFPCSISDFAKLIGVSVKTLQRWDRQGTLVADRTPTKRRVYTKNHYEKYFSKFNSDFEVEEIKENNPKVISTVIRIRKIDNKFIIEMKHLLTGEYIEINDLTSEKGANNFAKSKKADLEKIGIQVEVFKQQNY